MRIDRWNAGTMRRYHLASGAIAVVNRRPYMPRMCVVIPVWSNYMSCPVTPEAIAEALRAERTKQRTAP